MLVGRPNSHTGATKCDGPRVSYPWKSAKSGRKFVVSRLAFDLHFVFGALTRCLFPSFKKGASRQPAKPRTNPRPRRLIWESWSTRDEIHKAIEGEKDLPDDEKQDLLDSLDLPDGLPAEFRDLVPLMRNFEKWPGRF